MKVGQSFNGIVTRRDRLQVGTKGGDLFVPPSFRANGTVGANTSTTTLNVPLATNSVDDILIIIAFCRGSNIAFSAIAGWTELTQFDVDINRVGFWYKRAVSSEPAPVVTNTGRTATNLLSAQMCSFSGCKTSGTPFEGLSSIGSASDILTGVPVTASGNKRLALQLWVKGANTASTPDGNWTERLDQGTGGGGACRFMMDTAVMATPSVNPACSRALTAQLYGMAGLALIGLAT